VAIQGSTAISQGHITVRTQSLFLGGLGMMQIILTLPVALFVYRGVFRIAFFNQLHILAIYLVLGIGADDIFVFVDAWRQSVNVYENTADRLDLTYKRAARTMVSKRLYSFIYVFVYLLPPLSRNCLATPESQWQPRGMRRI
jgi:hypothetical protein